MTSDPTAITAVVIAVCSVIAAFTPIVINRHKRNLEKSTETVASWTSLNAALNKENQRVNGLLASQRADYEKQIRELRLRVRDLEDEVTSLRRQVAIS